MRKRLNYHDVSLCLFLMTSDVSDGDIRCHETMPGLTCDRLIIPGQAHLTLHWPGRLTRPGVDTNYLFF